jgi:hypothetical protein
MNGLLQDLRFTLRQLRQNPGFAAIAVLTVALGIGATTAMFSVVNAILLRPLPFREPERLMAIGEYDTRIGNQGNPGSVSYANVADVRARNHSFEDIAVYDWNQGTLTGARGPLHINFVHVNAGLFRLLGIQPLRGRDFRPEEDQPGHYVAIISHKLWRTYLNADANVTGRSIDLNGRSYTVVGVMPTTWAKNLMPLITFLCHNSCGRRRLWLCGRRWTPAPFLQKFARP